MFRRKKDAEELSCGFEEYMAQMRIVGVVSLPKKILRKVKKTIIG